MKLKDKLIDIINYNNEQLSKVANEPFSDQEIQFWTNTLTTEIPKSEYLSFKFNVYKPISTNDKYYDGYFYWDEDKGEILINKLRINKLKEWITEQGLIFKESLLDDGYIITMDNNNDEDSF